jgi:hypothetical protein
MNKEKAAKILKKLNEKRIFRAAVKAFELFTLIMVRRKACKRLYGIGTPGKVPGNFYTRKAKLSYIGKSAKKVLTYNKDSG